MYWYNLFYYAHKIGKTKGRPSTSSQTRIRFLASRMVTDWLIRFLHNQNRALGIMNTVIADTSQKSPVPQICIRSLDPMNIFSHY